MIALNFLLDSLIYCIQYVVLEYNMSLDETMWYYDRPNYRW